MALETGLAEGFGGKHSVTWGRKKPIRKRYFGGRRANAGGPEESIMQCKVAPAIERQETSRRGAR